MSFQHHYTLMAAYNKRINEQLYTAASNLNRKQLDKNMGAYFGSIAGSLNHILVGDLLWLSRFRNHSDRYQSLQLLDSYPKPVALDEILYNDMDKLKVARADLDDVIIGWAAETTDSDFEKPLTYHSINGKAHRKNFGEVVAHFFNHQTHHRGQISTMLSQLGVDIGVTDFIVDVPDD